MILNKFYQLGEVTRLSRAPICGEFLGYFWRCIFKISYLTIPFTNDFEIPLEHQVLHYE